MIEEDDFLLNIKWRRHLLHCIETVGPLMRHLDESEIREFELPTVIGIDGEGGAVLSHWARELVKGASTSSKGTVPCKKNASDYNYEHQNDNNDMYKLLVVNKFFSALFIVHL